MENVLKKSQEVEAMLDSSSYTEMQHDLAQPSRTDSHTFFQRATKRTLDVLGALTFFAIFGWLYGLVWFSVIASVGRPAIYKHTRVGKNGRDFKCLKFRSMVLNSAEVLQRYLEENPLAKAEWEKDFKLKNDPRITRFGKILRKTSLDELPQFWNVLKGEMSLVGPRPVVRKELEQYYGKSASEYARVRPGITGPWQVGGRSDLDYNQRVFLDVQYSRTWSITGDLTILVKTVSAVLSRRGSY